MITVSCVLALQHLSPRHCLGHPATAHNEVKNDMLMTAIRSIYMNVCANEDCFGPSECRPLVALEAGQVRETLTGVDALHRLGL